MPPKKAKKESPVKDKKESPVKDKKESPVKDKKGSPKKDKSPDEKASPKKDKNSPNKKNSPKKGKKDVEEAPPPPVELKLHKITSTFEDFAPYVFSQFRCTRCCIVFSTVQTFINHFCWEKFFTSKFHLGDTQALCCQTCDRLLFDEGDYSCHKCAELVPDDTIHLTYRNHFEFYINWVRRVKIESEYHDTDWKHLCKCLKCGNRFKNEISYLLHSCYLYSLMKAEITKNLCMCNVCKYVMLDEDQFDEHVKYCKKPDKAYSIGFETDLFQRACYQFVIGRHCYEYNLNKKNFNDPEAGGFLALTVGCSSCGMLQENITEFLYHPCMAGQLITPRDVELILLCNDCRCLFVNTESCMDHMRSCPASAFTFVRLTIPELRLALERWTVDIYVNTLLPERPEQLMCSKCLEIFRSLTDLMMHLCPRRPECIHSFMQPIGLQEMYSCQTCFCVLFTSSEAVEHSSHCTISSKTLMIQLHPTLEECLTCLKTWADLPRLLQLEISLGLPEVKEEIAS